MENNTILIQNGAPVAKTRDEKYLKCDDSGVWHLVFRVPACFDGKLIRKTLFTDDFDVAASIRDRFVVPVLAQSSGIAALKEIGKAIIAAGSYAIKHLGLLKNIIKASGGISLEVTCDSPDTLKS